MRFSACTTSPPATAGNPPRRNWASPATPPRLPDRPRSPRSTAASGPSETLHFIRDTCYREDHSRIRTRSGPRVLASLRNLAINALRLAGRTDITEATRWANRNMTRPFTILRLAG
nr:hypothetical protein Ade03nite_89040 [Actinoplanes derwentensis]